MKLVLASGSARRKELLSWLGIPFEVKVSGFDESGVTVDDPFILTTSLALAKAMTVVDVMKGELQGQSSVEKEIAPRKVEQVYVIGADTIVFFEGEVIGKPKNIDEARQFLLRLRGQQHQVYTGVAVVDLLTGEHKESSVVSEVSMKDYSDEMLEMYLSTSEPLGKAGGYRLLGKGKELVAQVNGSATNVSGLPLVKVAEILQELGIKIEVDVVKTIERKTGYSS
jgi:septum formation protein